MDCPIRAAGWRHHQTRVKTVMVFSPKADNTTEIERSQFGKNVGHSVTMWSSDKQPALRVCFDWQMPISVHNIHNTLQTLGVLWPRNLQRVIIVIIYWVPGGRRNRTIRSAAGGSTMVPGEEAQGWPGTWAEVHTHTAECGAYTGDSARGNMWQKNWLQKSELKQIIMVDWWTKFQYRKKIVAWDWMWK